MANNGPNTMSQRATRRLGPRQCSPEFELANTGWKEAFEEFKVHLHKDFDRSIALLEGNLGKASESLNEIVSVIEKDNEAYLERIKGLDMALKSNLTAIEKNAEEMNAFQRQSRKNRQQTVGEDCKAIIEQNIVTFPEWWQFSN